MQYTNFITAFFLFWKFQYDMKKMAAKDQLANYANTFPLTFFFSSAYRPRVGG